MQTEVCAPWVCAKARIFVIDGIFFVQVRLCKSIVSLCGNRLVFFVCVRASPNRDLNFIYCILRTLQVEAEVPFLEENESPHAREAALQVLLY